MGVPECLLAAEAQLLWLVLSAGLDPAKLRASVTSLSSGLAQCLLLRAVKAACQVRFP